MTENRLIVFVKNPVPGKVKTRLASTIGDEAALAIYLKLLAATHALTEQLSCDVVIYYNQYVDSEDLWDNRKYDKCLQQGADIGEKMYHAISSEIAKGYKHVGLIGSDIHQLTPQIIDSAFEKLKSHDVVLGPAKDGGYYLIGMNHPCRRIFDLPAWSTSEVFDQTTRRIKVEGLTYGQTDLLSDIDDHEDLIKAGLF